MNLTMIKITLAISLSVALIESNLLVSGISCPFASINVHHIAKGSTDSICGVVPDSCSAACYRSYDGSCNNLEEPSLGTTSSRYDRLLPANFGDDHSSPTLAVSGNELPAARKVSTTVYPDIKIEDPIWTIMTMQYGQFVSHDLSLQYGSTSSCCTDGQIVTSSTNSTYCYPIPVPDDDYAYSQFNITCLPFSRTVTDEDQGCLGNRTRVEQLSSVNQFMDLSLVYGNAEEDNEELRSFSDGKLISVTENNQEFMPNKTNTSACYQVNSSVAEACYLAGDVRANQNIELTVIHTLYLREHNRLATELAKLNPTWDDECLFQEARKINIAQHEYITYYEWLPVIIGSANALKKNIIYDTTDFVDDYDPKIDPSMLNEHATAAFRYFHTSVAGFIELITETRVDGGVVRISDYWNRPGIIEEYFDNFTRGLSTQAQLAADPLHDHEITLHMFREPGEEIGQDLRSTCIQRNRDHGLASYNDLREFCGLRKVETFIGFLDAMPLESVLKLKSLYESPDDVDLTVGGSLENLVEGTLLGPTFLCIFNKQFYKTRVGDRFWFENSGSTGFTLDQLNEIRKTSISRIICDNTGIISMQPRGFLKVGASPDGDVNNLVNCEDLPSVNLTLWTDSAGSCCSSSESTAASASTTVET